MRPCTRTIALAAAVAAGALADAVGESGPDVSCAWRTIERRGVGRRAPLTVRVRATIDVACDGAPAPRRITASLYASADGVVPTGAALAKKRVRPRSGHAVRVAFDAEVPFGAGGRYVIARVDDADEVVEPDEANNVAAFGPFATGEEYAPLETGNAWRYAGMQTSGDAAPVAYANSVDVLGPHVVGASVVAQAVSSSNSRNSGKPIVEYLQHDEFGVLDWGNDDGTDDVTAAITPYRAVLFPFAATYDVVTVARRGLPLSEDYDGDGRPERFDASQRTAFVGFEDVDLPVARFARCAHIRTVAVATLRLTYSGRSIRVVGTQHQWIAPGIGPVRSVEETTGPGISERIDETAVGAATAAGGFGVVDGRRIASISIAPGESSESPPAAASDGTDALVVSLRAAGAGEPHGLIGVVVSSTGTPLREFQIADVPVETYDAPTPAAAFGAGVFVVAYRRNGEPLHLRGVTSDGAAAWTGALDLPVATGADGAFRVAFDGTDFLVLTAGAEIPSGERSVSLARVSAAGSLLGSTRLTDTFAIFDGVALAWDGSSALCVWSVDTGLRSVRVAADGHVLDAAPSAFAGGPDYKSRPCVAASPSGGWFVAWTNSPSGGQTRVKGCRVSPGGLAIPSDGTAFVSSSYADATPQIALDGAEFVVVSKSFNPEAVRAVRVSLDGVEIPSTSGGLGQSLVAPTSDRPVTSPIVVQVGDRALVLWRTWSTSGGEPPAIEGALVFPRREDLRNERSSVR